MTEVIFYKRILAAAIIFFIFSLSLLCAFSMTVGMGHHGMSVGFGAHQEMINDLSTAIFTLVVFAIICSVLFFFLDDYKFKPISFYCKRFVGLKPKEWTRQRLRLFTLSPPRCSLGVY